MTLRRISPLSARRTDGSATSRSCWTTRDGDGSGIDRVPTGEVAGWEACTRSGQAIVRSRSHCPEPVRAISSGSRTGTSRSVLAVRLLSPRPLPFRFRLRRAKPARTSALGTFQLAQPAGRPRSPRNPVRNATPDVCRVCWAGLARAVRVHRRREATTRSSQSRSPALRRANGETDPDRHTVSASTGAWPFALPDERGGT